VGILGNETADFLAGEGAQNGKTIDYLPPYTDFYSIAREKHHTTVEKYLLAQSEIRGAQYFGLYPAFTRRPWFDRLNLSRIEITTVCRIRSNHYNLNYSLHRCGLIGRPDCPCGSSRQDIQHILWSCPLLRNHRTQLTCSLRKALGTPLLTVFLNF